MYIDVHWHHVPAAFVDAILSGRCPLVGAIDYDDGIPAVTFRHGFRLRLTDRLTQVEPALAALDEAGLDIATPSIAPPIRQYEAPAEIGVEICRAMNDAAVEVMERSGRRLRPLANVPMQDPQEAANELRRAIETLGLAGVAIGSNVEGVNIGIRRFDPFWQAVAELDAFVFIHPETVLGIDRLRHHEMENLVGFPVDTAVAVASLIFDGVFERFGPLKVCLAHGGGAFPYLVSRWQHGYEARLAKKGETASPYSYLDSIYCDSLTHGAKQLRFLGDVIGSDHIMLGSDYPFDMGDPQPVETTRTAIQNPAAVDAITGRTAARLLGFD